MQMEDRMRYDPQEDVVLIDLSNLKIDHSIVDQFNTVAIKLAAKLPHRVYALVCWENTEILPDTIEYYGEHSAKVVKYYKGLLRYAVNKPFTSISIRTEAVKNNSQGSKSLIYSSKKEALEAVNHLKKQS